MHETYDREIVDRAGRARPPALAPRLGIIGGGQLAKMTAMSGLRLGCDVVILEKNDFSPAATLATHSIVGDWDQPESLVKLAAQVDVVTIENEFVSASALATLEESGYPLFPKAATVAAIQDKLEQKRRLLERGVPLPHFRAIESEDDLSAFAAEFGTPFVLKTRRLGYDGKGNATVRDAASAKAAFATLHRGSGSLYAEAFCPFVRELAVMVVRGRNGEVVAYPVVESRQENHVCRVVLAPAAIDGATAERATRVAIDAVSGFDGIGAFGVELFELADGAILVNELAPRVHNSGHYTIEACLCSQFENHVRAVMGWPLGSPRMTAPAAAMVNLLGERRGIGAARGLDRALAEPGAYVHIYGKAMTGKGRKMGHVTALGGSPSEALAIASRAAAAIRFGGDSE